MNQLTITHEHIMCITCDASCMHHVMCTCWATSGTSAQSLSGSIDESGPKVTPETPFKPILIPTLGSDPDSGSRVSGLGYRDSGSAHTTFFVWVVGMGNSTLVLFPSPATTQKMWCGRTPSPDTRVPIPSNPSRDQSPRPATFAKTRKSDQKGSKKGPKRGPKSGQNDHFLDPFLITF